MAANTLDEILAQLSADERKLFDSTLSKNPALKDGWLRQDDYSRKMTTLTEKERAAETKQAEAVAERERLDAWADKTLPVWENLKEKGIVDDEGNEVWSTKQAEYERQVAEARAAAVSGGDMKPEELQALVAETVKTAGGATKAEIDALIQLEGRKVADKAFEDGWKLKETKFNEETIPFVAGFSSAASIVANHYEKETGELWSAEKQKEMYALMQAKKNYDPFAVEADLLKPHRDKKATEAEVERRVQEQVKTKRAEQGSGDDYIPQPGESKGALKMMLERSAEKDGDFNALISEQARKAGGELRQEGKVGTV